MNDARQPGSALQELLNLLGAKQEWINRARNALNGCNEPFLSTSVAQALASDRHLVVNPANPFSDHLKVAAGVGKALHDVLHAICDSSTPAASGALQHLMNTFETTNMVSILPIPAPKLDWSPSASDIRVQAAILSAATATQASGAFTSLVLDTLAAPSAQGALLEAVVSMPVLLHNELANRGEIGLLRIALRTGGPPGLHPETSMAFSHLDQPFLNGLRIAYALSKQGDTTNSITWSVTDSHGAPVRQFKGESITATLAIALNELPTQRAFLSRALWHLRPRKLDGNCAVTAGLRPDGRLAGVDHYKTKLAAVAAQEKPLLRIIVAANGTGLASQLPGDARSIAEQHRLLQRVTPAANLTQATTATRNKLNGHFVTAIAIFAVLIVTVTPVYLVLSGQTREAEQRAASQRQRDLTIATADKAATRARGLIGNGDQPIGLLVAMASDALSRQVGLEGNVLADILTESISLTKVIGASRGGRFNDLALSADGRTLIAAGNNGHVRIIDTEDGTTEWQHTYPPGLEIAPGQVWVTHVTLAPDGTLAVYTSTDDLIHLLHRDDSGHWAEVSIANSAGIPDALAISPDGKSVVASYSGDEAHITRYRVSPDRITHDYTCPSAGIQAAATLDNATLFATAWTVFTIADRRCRARNTFALPRSSVIHALGASPRGRLSVAASTPRGLQVFTPGRATRTVTTEPVETATLSSTSERTIVTFTNQAGTFGWSGESGHRYFGFKTPEEAVSDGDEVIAHIRDGTIELYRLGGGNLGVVREILTPTLPMALAYVSKDRLAVGTLNGVYIISTADSTLAADERSVLPGSAGFTTVIATRPDSDNIVAIESDPGGNGHLTGRSWNTETRMEIPVPVDESGRVPISATLLADDRLVLGHADGALRVLTLADGEWQETSRIKLPGVVSSLASDSRGTTLYALSRSASDRVTRPLLTQFTLRPTDGQLHRVASTTLNGLALAGELTSLEDGGVVVAVGAGDTTFYEADTLALQGDPIHGRLGVVTDVVELPALDQTVVVGRYPNLTIRTSTHTPLPSTQWSGNRSFLWVASNSEGTQIASATVSGILIWEQDSRELRQRTCEAVGGTLTPNQWSQYVSTDIPYTDPCA